MTKVYIVSGCRTPIGKFQGQFEQHSAVELGTIAVTEAINRAKLWPEDVEQCIMGQVLTAGQGQNPARQVALNAKMPCETSAYTINMLCGSALKSVALGFQGIKNGDYSIIVAGGQENMTRAQHTTHLRGTKLGALDLKDSLLLDGLTDVFHNAHMGDTAEHLAKSYKVSRKDQDEYALNCQQKTAESLKNGYFEKEIVGVPHKRTKDLIVKDEFVNPKCTIEKLSKLRPVWDQTSGTVTAGNSSGINDGAAAMILASEHQIKCKNLKPLVEIIGFAEGGLEPMSMGLGPIPAIKNLLQKIGWTKDDVDLYEINEAFAVQSMICIKELGLDPSKVNVAGGALALGHPIGASGSRCLVTLIYNLLRLGKSRGVVSLCIGGGMGIAMAVQTV